MIKHITRIRYRKIITSGRSEVEGRRPSDLADLTELKIFSPTLDKSIPPPWDNKNGTKKKTLELSKPSLLKSPLNKKGFPKTVPNGNKFGCISTRSAEIKGSKAHFRNQITDLIRACRDLTMEVSLVFVDFL